MFKNLLDDVLHLFYPRLCLACQRHSISEDEVFCIACESDMEASDYHLIHPNMCFERMQGLPNLVFATSMYRFYPGGKVQEIIHQIKYRGQTHTATILGQKYGQLLRKQPLLRDVDIIIPVPLHPRKQRKRGYNQSDFFAQGLGSSLHKPIDKKILKRTIPTLSQTAKHRLERAKSMQNAFHLTDRTNLHGKHVLLVDDVMTTGATLYGCADAFQGIEGLRISLATIAIAQ